MSNKPEKQGNKAGANPKNPQSPRTVDAGTSVKVELGKVEQMFQTVSTDPSKGDEALILTKLDLKNPGQFETDVINPHMFKAMEEICKSSNIKTMSQKDWQQLLSAKTLQSILLASDGINDSFDQDARDLIKELIYDYVGTDQFKSDLQESLDKMTDDEKKHHVEPEKAETPSAEEPDSDNEDDTKVFMVSDGKVVDLNEGPSQEEQKADAKAEPKSEETKKEEKAEKPKTGGPSKTFINAMADTALGWMQELGEVYEKEVQKNKAV